jgi:hypothetical protein
MLQEASASYKKYQSEVSTMDIIHTERTLPLINYLKQPQGIGEMLVSSLTGHYSPNRTIDSSMMMQ